MAAMAAAELDPDLAGGEINIIMGNRQRIRVELIEIEDLADRKPGPVHEKEGFDQQYLLATEVAFGNRTAAFFTEAGKSMLLNNSVKQHEPDIVPVPGIAGARIAKTCNCLLYTSPSPRD